MTNKTNSPTLFNLFWENSKINKRTILKLATMLSDDARTSKMLPQLYYPTEDLLLSKPTDALINTMMNRKNIRAFTTASLSEKQLGSLLYGLGQQDSINRLLPSAGAKYPIEVYGFLFNVSSKLNQHIVYYNADKHTLSVVKKSPAWDELKEFFGLELDGIPAVVFVFVAIPERTMDKYGERGGRFILIEAGHYTQNLALRLSHEHLGGVLSGALHDDEIKKILGLDNTTALMVIAFACGKT
ncbi:MAG: SagB/ThcOx family dehydrogenase [bacterium]